MCQITLDKNTQPLPTPRKTPVTQSIKITRRPKEYELRTQLNQKKEYQLGFNKRVLRPGTAITYPYGYPLTDADRFNDGARGLFPDAGEDDEEEVTLDSDDEEEVTLDAADVANIDALVDLMD